ncbi:MAG: hypothetical protein AAGG01_21970, partial [Planctomycetota bacterium]
TTSSSQSLVIEVVMLDAGACNEYDLGLALAQCSCGVGTPYCQPNANSTGQASSIVAAGSIVAAANDVTLSVQDLPSGAACLFLVSDTQAFIPNPGGSEGNLCLGGGIGRYAGPGQVMVSSASGSVSLTIDLTQVPTPFGPSMTDPGDTWNFQLWHRDVDGGSIPTSNFSNARTITFQ